MSKTTAMSKREQIFCCMRVYKGWLIEDIEWDAKIAKRHGLPGISVVDFGNAKRLTFFATRDQSNSWDEERHYGPPENRNWPGDDGYDPSKPIGAWYFTGGPPADYYR
jgi:hypothetical protein